MGYFHVIISLSRLGKLPYLNIFSVNVCNLRLANKAYSCYISIIFLLLLLLLFLLLLLSLGPIYEFVSKGGSIFFGETTT